MEDLGPGVRQAFTDATPFWSFALKVAFELRDLGQCLGLQKRCHLVQLYDVVLFIPDYFELDEDRLTQIKCTYQLD